MSIDGQWIKRNETKEFKEGPYVSSQSMTFDEYIELREQIFQINEPALRYDRLTKLDDFYSSHGEEYVVSNNMSNMSAQEFEDYAKQAEQIISDTQPEIERLKSEVEEIFDRVR